MSNTRRADGPSPEQYLNISWIVNVVNNAAGPIALHHREKQRTVTIGARETRDLSDFPFPWVGAHQGARAGRQGPSSWSVDGRVKYLLFHEYETD
jgi:hypothetical protein